MLLEICVQGIDSALAAQEGGADRIELCEDLAVGGVTPSAGMIAVTCGRLSIPVQVLIRPRGGDFVYSELEFEVMRHDVATARTLGASGVVIGLLTREGRIDRYRTARLVEAARPMNVTFHKAFDETPDPFESLAVLRDLGIDRILTSGHAPTARQGRGLLAELVRRSAERIVIMAGGQIRAEDRSLLISAGVDEIHVGSAACVGGRTDAGKVRELRVVTSTSG